MNSSVASRAVGLGALTAAGQLIVIGTLPVYSRIFDPAVYGQYLIFVGLVGITSVFAGVRYDSAIVLPRNDAMARRLSVLVMFIAIGLAVVIAAATLLARFAGPAFGGRLGLQSDLGYGLAAATALGAAQRCLASWCIRDSRFFLMGFGLFLFSLMTVVLQLAMAHIMGQLPALIWGYVGALGIQAACLSTLCSPSADRAWNRSMALRGMRVAARKYRRFPRYMVGYALASSARDRLVQIMLGIGAGAAVVGRFGLAYRVVFAPNSLIYSAVSPIFFAVASRGSKAGVGRFAASLVEATFVALVVPYVVVACEAPALTDSLLSLKWQGTGPFLQALAGPALLLSATCWLDRAFDSFNRQKVAFALEATFTAASVSLVAVLSRLVDPVVVAWSFGAMAVIYYWTYFLMVFVSCGFPLQEFRKACVTGLVALVTALGVAFAAHRIGSLALRLLLDAGLMAIVILGWIKTRGGADVLRLLVRSRVGSQGLIGHDGAIE